MEDILASIRRILAEDELPPIETEARLDSGAAAPAGLSGSRDDNVLVLDDSMMVDAPTPPPPELMVPAPEPAPLAAVVTPDLVAPAAVEAAAQSVGNLMRTLAAGRSMTVSTGGPTVEDIVRDTVRPLVKEWLDTHLPELVERLVRIEIERVVGRAV